MIPRLQAVFFDVDGVLIDSLPQHLQICRDKAAEFGLRLAIPSVEEFRDLVRRGVKVSPMRNFFLAVGFPPAHADRAVADYEAEFMRHYHPPAFSGIDRILATLAGAGVALGIVTANTRGNVEPTLSESLRYFDRRLLFYYDGSTGSASKSSCLKEGARCLGVVPEACCYVGDQPADAAAAREAGCRFQGVAYGWGISLDDRRFHPVARPEQLPRALLGIVPQRLEASHLAAAMPEALGR